MSFEKAYYIVFIKSLKGSSTDTDSKNEEQSNLKPNVIVKQGLV